MEVRPALKWTDIGFVPADWDLVRFSDLLEFRNGVNADKLSYGAGVRFINVLEVITKSHLHASDIPGRVSLARPAIESYRVRRGDVVFNRTSETQEEVGLAAVYADDEDVVFGGFVIRGRQTGDADLDDLYSGYALRAPCIRRQIIARGQGAIRANVGQHDLRSVLVPRPPRPEQIAIAEALSDVDALIESLEQLIAKWRQLTLGAMQALLTGRKRLPGFESKRGYKQTDLGVLPEDWDVASLGAVCRMKSGEGITSARIDQFSEYPCYGGNGLRGFTSRFTHDGRYALIGRQGALCGNVLGVEGKLFASEHAIVVAPSVGTDIHWLTFVLGAMRLNQYSESSAQPGLSVWKLLSLQVAIPPTKPEQEAIAAILSDMDAEIESLKAKLFKARQLKQGMAQELLTGRIRLA